MKYNFNIILNGQMEATTEKELVEKLSSIINRNPVFQELEKAFDISIERESILSEADDDVFDMIAEDFKIEKEQMIENFYEISIDENQTKTGSCKDA